MKKYEKFFRNDELGFSSRFKRLKKINKFKRYGIHIQIILNIFGFNLKNKLNNRS